MIKFLKNCNGVPTAHVWTCGDGCCSENIWENEDYEAGDEKDEDLIDISHLTENIDYIKE